MWNPKINLKNYEKKTGIYIENILEVHCFCQIDDIIEDKLKIIDKKITIKNTKYFLVGGFEIIKGGRIFLYEFIYDEESCHVKINNIVEVGFEEFEDLKSINSIIQSKKTRIILISCSNGKNYFFKFNGCAIIESWNWI